MKKLLLASATALALTTGSALAADLYRPAPVYKAPPAPVAVYNWTGCYVDGGVGYGMWDENHFSEVGIPPVAFTETSNSAGEGWLGRVGAGCDYQIGSSWLIGAFGDYDFMDLHGDVAGLNGVVPLTADQKETGAWGVGGRIGYLVTPALLTYFDGGYTEARFGDSQLLSSIPPSPDSGLDLSSQTYHGWFIGGGYEYSLNSILPVSGLFWRTEYRYASYQGRDVPVIGDPGVLVTPGAAEHIKPTVQTITSGLVWRFNFGGPIATRD